MGNGSAETREQGLLQGEYPVLHLMSSVVFPNDVVSIQLPDEDSAAPLECLSDEQDVVATTFDGAGSPGSDMCVLCRVAQRMQIPGGGQQVVFQGLARAVILDSRADDGVLHVKAEEVPDLEDDTPETNQAVLEVLDLLAEYLPREGTYPEDLESVLRMNVTGPGRFADLVAAHLHLPLSIKREVAATADVLLRLDILVGALEAELARFSVETDVHRRVRDHMEDRQREQYLRQQMRAIRQELGDDASSESDADDLAARLAEAGLSKEAHEVAEREIRRLRSVSPSSAEYQVIRTYVGWLLDLPWKKRTRDRLDIARARRILDEDHSGLKKVKERILEHLAVRKLKRNLRGPILCLVGPPGVGKTSLGKSVARALGRKFVRMSVGGLRDEAEIKGHRRTYVGAMPGKLLQLIKRAGVRNPVLQIDEIDKMGSDHRGDPASAVLEVLDPECNASFRDHYLDVGYDLSEVFFLVTANLLETIPAALRDRLEIIRMGGYTRVEKLTIANEHLVPRAIRENGLKPDHVRFTAGGLERIIDGHTREAGLRELERNLSKVCRKVATRFVEGDTAPVRVGRQRVAELLGPERYRPDLAGRRAEIGVATGMAWTSCGGALLTIEANRMPGKGNLTVTGRLGEVMRESAQAALSYVRTHCEEYDIEPSAFTESDVHVHFPEGATPKDGPSAGVAIATCLASLFTGRSVRHDLAMTGEITLKGRVLEVGGIKEKLLAAHRAGIRQVLIPKDNLKDLEDVPKEIKNDLEIMGTEDVEHNICEALLSIIVPDKAPMSDVETEPQPMQVRKR
jgi:ATP-dependent Lon protease